MSSNPNQRIDTDDVNTDLNFLRQDAGGMITNHNGMADKLLKNDKLYNAMKGNWTRTDWNGSQNIKITTGRENGKFYITLHILVTGIVLWNIILANTPTQPPCISILEAV